MTEREAIDFVRTHGVVLQSARGPVPRLVDAIAGEPVRGSWWSHAKGRAMFRVFAALEECDDVVACRLIDGKITYVHRRLWPALVRMAARFTPAQLARARQQHTETGHHERRDVPFPEWVPREAMQEAATLAEAAAIAALAPLLAPQPRRSPAKSRAKR